MKYLPAVALLLTLSFPILQFAQTIEQTPSQVPAQIASAHTIFLSNSGSDSNFPIDSTRVYNDVYAALQSWGHYQMASSPAQADLIFQLRDVAPITDITGGRGGVYTYTSPAFQLTVVDPKTNVTLWTITSPVELAGRNKVYDHWVSVSETNLVSRIQVLAGQPLSAEQTAELTTVPHRHHARTVALVTVGAVGIAAAGALILHHEFENGVDNQKATQDAFCTAHGIPLSMCAGG